MRNKLARLAQTFKDVSSRANGAYYYGALDWQFFERVTFQSEMSAITVEVSLKLGQ